MSPPLYEVRVTAATAIAICRSNETTIGRHCVLRMPPAAAQEFAIFIWPTIAPTTVANVAAGYLPAKQQSTTVRGSGSRSSISMQVPLVKCDVTK